MRACPDCLPCLARNAVELARRSARGDAALEARIASEGMRILADAAADGFALPPPCYARRLIDNALSMSGAAVPDPWAKEKQKSTEMAERLMKRLGFMDNAQSSFERRLRLSIAGNILDFSIYADLDIATAMAKMDEAFTKPISGAFLDLPPSERRVARSVAAEFNRETQRHRDTEVAQGACNSSVSPRLCASVLKPCAESAAAAAPSTVCLLAALQRRMDEARSILWIFDNCGEAVFDRPLIEPYRNKITLAVRGKPAFNDMTRAELAASGYPEGFAGGGVVSNDDGIPGVVDSTCGEAFRAAFDAADLVVAKGQANFETMNERTDKPIAFLFLAKCPVVCRAIGAEPGTIQVLLRNIAPRACGTMKQCNSKNSD